MVSSSVCQLRNSHPGVSAVRFQTIWYITKHMSDGGQWQRQCNFQSQSDCSSKSSDLRLDTKGVTTLCKREHQQLRVSNFQTTCWWLQNNSRSHLRMGSSASGIKRPQEIDPAPVEAPLLLLPPGLRTAGMHMWSNSSDGSSNNGVSVG